MDSDLSTWCAARTEPTPEETAQLDTIPDADHQFEAERGCEIRRDGHDGPHMTLGQAAGENEWWLVWDGAGLREIRLLPPCPTEDMELGKVCVLPLEHDGLHSFAP